MSSYSPVPKDFAKCQKFDLKPGAVRGQNAQQQSRRLQPQQSRNELEKSLVEGLMHHRVSVRLCLKMGGKSSFLRKTDYFGIEQKRVLFRFCTLECTVGQNQIKFGNFIGTENPKMDRICPK